MRLARIFVQIALGAMLVGCTSAEGELFTQLDAPVVDTGVPTSAPPMPVDAGIPLPGICPPPQAADALVVNFNEGKSAGYQDSLSRQVTLVGDFFSESAGPGGCNLALDFTPENRFAGGSYVVVPDNPAFHLKAGSVSFRLRLTPGAIPPKPPMGVNAMDVAGARGVGLIVRDAYMTTEAGHFAVLLNNDGQIVARIQTLTNQNVTRCSTPVPTDRWIQIVVNFGEPAFELFIDGVEQNETGVAIFDALCGGSLTLGLDGNSNPWVLGTDATPSDDGAATPQRVDGYLGGASMDDLRLSSERYVP